MSRARTWGIALAIAATLASPAWAGPDDEIDTIDAAAADLDARTGALVARSSIGTYLTPEEAITRFQDYLFLHLIGQHMPAAEGFFALVTTGVLTDAGMHRDAEWYLAESLAGVGNLQTAATRFRVIVDDPKHPFRTDAVRRLLELYAQMDERDAFQRLYDDEIVTGRVQATGLITYSLAKSFYLRGERANARQYFQQVPTDNEWYGRARYFLAVMDVEDRNLAAARQGFQDVAALSVQTPDDRRVHDLALLALGRIAYDQKEFQAAYDAYTSISADSEYQDQRLYETAWTSIRREDWHDALNNVEIFLLAYPDHQYAAQLRLVQGHLNYQQRQWTDALSSYEVVLRDYEPVRAQFAALSAAGADGDAAVEAFLKGGGTDARLPEYAVAMMRSDPELGRTLDVFHDLESQRTDIETSESLVSELRAYLLGTGAASSYDRMRMDAYYYRSRAVGLRLDLLGIEGRWLGDTTLEPARAELERRWKQVDVIVAGGAAQLEAFERDLASLRMDVENARLDLTTADRRIGELEPAVRIAGPAERPGLEAELAQVRTSRADAQARMDDANRKISVVVVPDVSGAMPSADLEALWRDTEALSAKYRDLRGSRSTQATAARADGAHTALRNAYDRLGAAVESIEANATGELGKVRERFDAEVANVTQERADYEHTLRGAQAVSLDVTRRGFGRLEEFFASSLLSADQGIVDVYWAEKLETDDELVAVREEKDATLAELDRRFTLIREKLGATGGKK